MAEQRADNVSDSVVIQLAGNGNSVSVACNDRGLLNLELPIGRKREASLHPDPVMRTINTYAETTRSRACLRH